MAGYIDQKYLKGEIDKTMTTMKRNRLIAIITAFFMLLSIEAGQAVFSYGAENPDSPAAEETQAEQAASADPADPEAPTAPAEPSDPTQPEQPTEPETPSQPEQPRAIEGRQPEAKVVSVSAASVKLSWKPVKDAAGYRILTADRRDGTYRRVTAQKSTAYTHKNLQTGKAYYYKIQAYEKAEGRNYYSKLSEAVKAVPLPEAPKLSLTAGGGQITIKWAKISGVSGYAIYRATSAKGSFKRIAQVKAAKKPQYVNKKLGESKTYYFKARAYKTVDGKKVYGPFSAVKKKKTMSGLDWRVTQVYNAATKNVKGKSKIKRLRACYDYMINGHFGYTRRGMVARGAKGWQARYAEQFLKDRTGNCFGWAATFYYLAKKCGYSPRIYSGSCHYRNGNTGRHGWTEITMNGRSYIFDPEMHWSYIHRVGSYYNGWKRVPGTTAMRYIK